MTQPPTCLIVVRHGIVAEDLAITVAETLPGLAVRRAATAPAALALLADVVSPVLLAFLGEDPAAAGWQALLGRLRADGTRLVLLPHHDAADTRRAVPDALVLDMPFTTEMVVGLIARAGITAP